MTGVGEADSGWPTFFDEGDTLGFDAAVIAQVANMDPLDRVDVMAEYLQGKAAGGSTAARDVLGMLAVSGLEEATDLERAIFADYLGRMLQQAVGPEEVSNG